MAKKMPKDISRYSRADLARFYHVSEMTISNWIRKGAPVWKPEEMILYGCNLQRRSPGFESWMRDYQNQTQPKGAKESAVDPDWLAAVTYPNSKSLADYLATGRAMGATDAQLRQAIKDGNEYRAFWAEHRASRTA